MIKDEQNFTEWPALGDSFGFLGRLDDGVRWERKGTQGIGVAFFSTINQLNEYPQCLQIYSG